MPQILKHIDQIARDKGRDVLFVKFENSIYKYYENSNRKELVDWLNINKIQYLECFGIANENSLSSYNGEIYIDICYDLNDPIYIKINNYLENTDGTPRFTDTFFYLLPLETAMKNRQHDHPNFWKDWADSF